MNESLYHASVLNDTWATQNWGRGGGGREIGGYLFSSWTESIPYWKSVRYTWTTQANLPAKEQSVTRRKPRGLRDVTCLVSSY